MIEALVRLGAGSLGATATTGRAGMFLWRLLAQLPASVRRPGGVVRQLYNLGVLSLIIILVSGLFVGMVLGLQGYNTLVDFGAEGSLGTLVGLSLVRELGPVMSALLFAGRAGSALTAEIGLMKATEQLSALEMMAVDPFPRVLAPRWLAGFIAMPLLAVVFSAVGILGGYLVGVELLGVDAGSYWTNLRTSVDFYDDLLNGVIKSVVFGAVVCWVALFQGYDCVPTAEGVGRATTRTVVMASLGVLGFDFLLTALMYGEVG
ncbi:MAG: lipid asymmetry maintenance ABC transporter permease subunit MlaE [Gammaproteobacteria bacterium]|nr:lipid asymmetry maintenance ABC transporter permease subunit MlaE [Gammaproteobacteria bacterium]